MQDLPQLILDFSDAVSLSGTQVIQLPNLSDIMNEPSWLYIKELSFYFILCGHNPNSNPVDNWANMFPLLSALA